MKNKSFFAGMITMLIIVSLLGTAAAVSTTKTAELVYRDIKITLDGEQITPTDANGVVVEPFIIDGTTYLPVRAVADAMGLSANWDANTNTVGLYSAGNNHEEEISEIDITLDGYLYNGNYGPVFEVYPTNNTDKTVTRFDAKFKCYDAYGEELDCIYDYLYYSAPIKSGGWDARSWDLTGANGIYKLEIGIYKCAFDDGTIIEVPDSEITWYTFTLRK